MSDSASSRAADMAAEQVEQIVAAAQRAAHDIEQRAHAAAEASRQAGEQEAEALRLAGSRDADKLREDAEREAAERLKEARREAVETVAAAREAAEEVASDARSLTAGLRRLGDVLGDQGERILRDVQAAHRRMTADLRIAGEEAAGDERRPRSGATARRSGGTSDTPRTRRPARPPSSNPLRELDVPDWGEPDR